MSADVPRAVRWNRLSNLSLVRQRMVRGAAEDKQRIVNSIDLPEY